MDLIFKIDQNPAAVDAVTWQATSTKQAIRLRRVAQNLTMIRQDYRYGRMTEEHALREIAWFTGVTGEGASQLLDLKASVMIVDPGTSVVIVSRVEGVHLI